MLVVLNGVVSIRKHYFATRMTTALNNMDHLSVDDYIVNLIKNPFEVYSGDTLVYRIQQGTDEGVDTLIHTDGGVQTLQKIVDIKTLCDNYAPWEYKDDFNDGLYDLGITKVQHFDNDIGKVFKAYAARKFETQVILGIFSKGFLEQVVNGLGAENVYIVNVIRNPSCSYLFDLSPQSGADGINFPQVGARLFGSLFNSIMLKELDYVHTVKYEDIIKDQKITINGIDVLLPDFAPYNDNITIYEQQIANLPEVQDRNLYLDKFNTEFANLDKYGTKKGLIDNVFQRLGYSPLTFDEIVNNGVVTN